MTNWLLNKLKRKEYIYFVGYSAQNTSGSALNGNCELISNVKINNLSQIRNIEELIKRTCKYQKVVILGYKLIQHRK